MVMLPSTVRSRLSRAIGRSGRCRATSSAAEKGGGGAEQLVELEVQGQVAILRLNNPSKLNALTVPMGLQFERTVNNIAHDIDRDIRAVILTGAGSAFSAGGDLNWLHERISDESFRNVGVMRSFYAMFLSIRQLPVPVISAINGPAVGAGLCLALATDIRITSSDAKLGVTFVNLGLHPGMGCSYYLPKITSPQTASRLLLGGEVITGEEAFRLGIVAQSVPQEDVMDAAIKVAKKIAKASPVAVRATVKTLRTQMDEGLDAALQKEASAQTMCYKTADFAEGLKAAHEKRAPSFSRGFHPSEQVI